MSYDVVASDLVQHIAVLSKEKNTAAGQAQLAKAQELLPKLPPEAAEILQKALEFPLGETEKAKLQIAFHELLMSDLAFFKKAATFFA